jgi:vacuolar-type H+-ATPase subunit C/Vma6
MKSKMLAIDGYDRLLRCSSSSECMAILREEGYFGTLATAGELVDPASWQSLFDARLVTIVHKLTNLSPNDCAQLLTTFEVQCRLELLKSGLRLMVTQREGKPPDSLPPELSRDLLRGTLKTRSVERLVEASEAMELYGEISSALAEKKPIPLLETMVDKYVLTRMWKATDMPDWVDKQSVQTLVGERIDAINLLAVTRSKTLGISGDEIQESLVPVNYRLGDALLEAAKSGSATTALRAFTKTTYADPVERFVETYKEGDTLHPLDVSLQRRHAASCLSAFSGFPFCAGLPIAFAYLVWYELSDLRTIVSGKHDGVPTEKIEPFLVLQKAL